MKPQLLALLAAAAWGIGGYFEKQGLQLGNLSPQLGITLRTAVALAILGGISLPEWQALSHAGGRALGYMVVGGGIMAGAVGMLCFYSAIKGAPLSQVMPLAFTAPLFGVLMGVMFGAETLSPRLILGAGLTVGGIAILTSR